MNCAIQSTPNPLKWATSSVIVCTGGARCALAAHASVTATEIVERAKPANDRAQTAWIANVIATTVATIPSYYLNRRWT